MRALRHLSRWANSPRMVATEPQSGSVPDWLTDLLTWPEGPQADLAALYREVGRRSRQREHRTMHIRALLAEASAEFERTGALPTEPLYYAVMQHRLARSSTAAQSWASALLRHKDLEPLYQARLWRELAAIHEVAGHYKQGLFSIDKSLAVCAHHPDDERFQAAAAQSQLQRSTLLRLSGHYAEARQAIADAREAAGSSTSPLILGLIAQREAGLDLVIGHLGAAERGYQEAARLFDGVSANNRRYALTRQVSCLRAQGDLDAAAELGAKLLAEVADDSYRTGQVLLELAEIQLERRSAPNFTLFMDQAAPLLSHGESVESLRWRTLLARSAIVFENRDGPTMVRAQTALCEVLHIANSEGRNDITRILMALHSLAELSTLAGASQPEMTLQATRAAVIAAELQRTALVNVDDRWQMKQTREAVYAMSALLHTQLGQPADVAALLELGKADLIEQALGNPTVSLLQQNLASSPPPRTPQDLTDAVASLIKSLTGVRPPEKVLPPLPTTADPAAGFAHTLTIGVINDNSGWTAIRAFSSPGTSWASSTVQASPSVSALLTRLVHSASPDLRGVSNRTWQQLGTFLIPEELATFHTGSLLISPDPRLWRLPWAALPVGERYLIDRGPLILTPSLLSHSTLAQRPPACGNGREASNAVLDDTLCGSELESAALREWSRLHDALPGMLYITGHASSPESTLSAGKLDFDTLARSQLPEIVVLNGCWTGASRPVYGRDPFSLAVGALIGGARLAIAGSGHIGSEASARVGVELLRGLAEGEEALSALRQAQIGVRDSHPETGPMDWGGLVAVG